MVEWTYAVTFPWHFNDLRSIPWLFPDNCQIPWHFQVLQKSDHSDHMGVGRAGGLLHAKWQTNRIKALYANNWRSRWLVVSQNYLSSVWGTNIRDERSGCGQNKLECVAFLCQQFNRLTFHICLCHLNGHSAGKPRFTGCPLGFHSPPNVGTVDTWTRPGRWLSE